MVQVEVRNSVSVGNYRGPIVAGEYIVPPCPDGCHDFIFTYAENERNGREKV